MAIAVALANTPSVPPADKPTGELDSATGEQVFAAFRRTNEELGTTIVIVTHAQAVAAEVRRTVAIRDGRTSSEVLRHTEVDAATGRESLVAREYAMLDRAGRPPLPADCTEALGMEHRVMVDSNGTASGSGRTRPGSDPRRPRTECFGAGAASGTPVRKGSPEHRALLPASPTWSPQRPGR